MYVRCLFCVRSGVSGALSKLTLADSNDTVCCYAQVLTKRQPNHCVPEVGN